jgi:S1-C subfamily serine protease
MNTMISAARWPAALLVVAGSALVVARQNPLERLFHFGRADEQRTLKLGEVRQGQLDLAREHSTEFTLDVPEGAVLLRVKIKCRQADLELSARSPDGDDEADPEFKVDTDAGAGTLTVSRFSDPPLAAGAYRIQVAWRSKNLPRTVDKRVDRIPFSLEPQLFEKRVDGTLVPDRAVDGVIDTPSGGYRTFQIDVPPGARALRVDIADAESDLDLFAERGHPMLALSEDVYFAQHTYGRETLVIDAQSRPPLEPGAWFVDVIDVQGDDSPTPFKILATLDAAAPAQLLAIPRAPAAVGRGVLARALASVVELSTDDGAGSGTLLTPDGWILTNAHVVTGLGDEVQEEVVISIPVDPHRPSVESFRGHVEKIDKPRDLALVRVTSGFYGQPLPSGYVFPTVEMGGSEELAIGEPLWLVGYPSTGGQGSRVTITATRGIVSGFDRAEFGTVVKTDATITLGNSGGAAIDSQGRIVGVPTSTVEVGSGHIGYVHPLSALPEDWRALIRSHLVR